MENEEKYIGSVIFFKRVILTATILAVAIPLGACAVLLYLNYRTDAASAHAIEEIAQMQIEIREAGEQIEETKEAMEDLLKVELDEKEPSALPWNLILVNEMNPLQEEFEVELVKFGGGKQVDARIEEPLEAMFAAMREEGLQPMVCSGYRSLTKQKALFKECVTKYRQKGLSYEEAYYKTKTRQAVPGASEHHTGLAVDIVGKSHQSLNASQANTKEAIWLAQHCAEYGFILRYPKEAFEITGREYESWHFRYVGKEAASYIMKHGITLEEYIEKIGES